MIMRLILWLSVLWIAPLVVGVLVNDAKFKKNLAVGVTIPPEFQADPDIAAHLARFRRQEWTLCVILAAAAIPCIFVRDFGRNMTLWSVWLLLVCVLPYAPYARCNLALKRLKAERGWRRETAPRTETVDLSAIPSYRWLSPWLFALPFVVSLLPLLWSAENWIVLLTDAGCVVLFWLCYRFCYRKKSERVDENAELAKVLSQVRLHRWGRLWLVSAWMMAALNLMFSLAEPNSVFSLCAFGAVVLLHITYLLYTEFRLRALQAKLTAGAATGALVDEDDRWIFGQFYYNPDDRHLIVNARTGLNTTVNLAAARGTHLHGLCGALSARDAGDRAVDVVTRHAASDADGDGDGADQHLRNQRDPHPTRGDHRGYAFGRTAGRPVAHKRNFDGASGVWALFLARVWRD